MLTVDPKKNIFFDSLSVTALRYGWERRSQLDTVAMGLDFLQNYDGWVVYNHGRDVAIARETDIFLYKCLSSEDSATVAFAMIRELNQVENANDPGQP